MADDGSILVTGAAGQLGSVGRTVTGLLLERGFPVRAWCGVRTNGRRPYEPRAPKWWSATCSNRVMFIAPLSALPWSISACPFLPDTSRLP
jgi:nucleoside-diphosphate-sugar epimerase